MFYNVPLPSLSIEHPVFSVRPPFYRPHLSDFDRSLVHPWELSPWRSLSRFAVGEAAGGVGTCLLPHISPLTSAHRARSVLVWPPAPGVYPIAEPSEVESYLVNESTGEILDTLPTDLFDEKDLVWVNPGAGEDCEYWLQIYNNDVKIKRPTLQADTSTKGKRGQIFEFSPASMNRLLFICRNSGHLVQSQFCCTFHNSWPLDGKALKKMLERFIKRLKRKFGRGIHYLWVLEFQEREAPHIHFFSDIPPTRHNRWFLADAWLDASDQTGDSKCRWWHRRPKNFFTWEMKSGAYLAKEYIGKVEQKEVPDSFKNVGRFWAASQNMTPDYATVNPIDHDYAYREVLKKTVRTITRACEKKIDQGKAFVRRFHETLALFGVPASEISGKTKKEIAIGIKLNGSCKTTRLRPATNLRRRKQTLNLTGMADAFYSVLNHYTSPPVPSGFKAFSSWANDQTNPPPARRSPTPF